jgi:hypothetical protein
VEPSRAWDETLDFGVPHLSPPGLPVSMRRDGQGVTLSKLAPANRLPTFNSWSLHPPTYVEIPLGLIPGDPQAAFPSASWPTPADVLMATPDAVPSPLDFDHVQRQPSWVAPLVESAMHEVGRRMADLAPSSAAATWANDAAELLGAWTAKWSVTVDQSVTPIEVPVAEPQPSAIEAAPPSNTTLRLVDPRERVATVDPRFAVRRSESDQRAPTEPAPADATTRPRDEFQHLKGGIWSAPDVLLAQIEHLTHYPHSEQWALATLERIRALVEGDRRDRGRSAALLAALSESAAQAVPLAEQSPDERLRVELLRAHWALERRLACWTAMRDIRTAAISRARIAARGSLAPYFQNWTPDDELETLSADLESYERFRDPHIGRQVAQSQRQLRSSSSDLDHALAEAVEENYRNANVRVAVTAEMLNRFVAQERVQARPVRERIAGTPVRGHSETTSRSQITFQPTLGRWQMQMRTDGVVESETSSVGRAKVFTHGATQFTAQTPIVVHPTGQVENHSTQVIADNCSHLLGVSTGVDWIPIVGSLARSQVVSQYQKKRPRAKSEIEFKVANRTREQVEGRTEELVSDVRGQVQERLTNPLTRYGIEITPLEMTTTAERIVARLRIASGDQLAAHTPRPRALSDSLFSMQLHESAMTNAAVALALNGERLTASQLQARLREKLPRLALEQPPEAPDNTTFQFAPADAVRFRVDDGRLELALAITQFSQQNTRIRNFIVHAFYKPAINGLTAELVRDGGLGIEGSVGASDRARLHNVFKVVLSEDRALPIFRPANPQDPRLAGLMITQLVLEDGWLGVSVGPLTENRVAERQRSLW